MCENTWDQAWSHWAKIRTRGEPKVQCKRSDITTHCLFSVVPRRRRCAVARRWHNRSRPCANENSVIPIAHIVMKRFAITNEEQTINMRKCMYYRSILCPDAFPVKSKADTGSVRLECTPNHTHPTTIRPVTGHHNLVARVREHLTLPKLECFSASISSSHSWPFISKYFAYL